MQDSWTDWPHQPDEQSRNRSRILTILTVVSVFPLFLLAGRILASGLPEVAMLSDHALLELSILRATTFDQLLGPYSRFGFHYPGPALAYLFAPGYLLSGCRYLSAAVSIAVINGVCIALLLWMVKRNEGTTAMAWTAALLSLLAVHVEPSVLSSPWNPHATILPFLLTLGAAASLANGRVWALPIAVASGSLCVQSHLVYALPLVVVATISLAGWITAKRREGLSKNRVIAIVSAALIAIAMWTPLVVAELSTDDSNLAKIANFILQDAPENSVGTAFSTVGYRYAAPTITPIGVRARAQPEKWATTVSLPIAALIVVMLMAGAIVAQQRGARFAAALCVLCLATTVAAVFVVVSIRGELHDYLVRWISSLGALAVAAAGLALGPAMARRMTRRVQAVGVSLLSLALLWLTTASILQITNYRDIAELQHNRAGTLRLTQAAAAAADEKEAQDIHLHISKAAAWPHAAAVFTRLAKDGRRPTVDDRWAWLFGERGNAPRPDTLMSVSTGEARRLGLWNRLATDGSIDLAMYEPSPLPDEALLFGTPEIEPLLIGGFYAPEGAENKAFRWSKGPTSTLIVPLREGVEYQLSLELAPFFVPGTHQELEAEINGVSVGSAVFPKPGWSTRSFEIPAGLARILNEVTFHYTVVRSPAELGRSGDSRKLAFQFRRITLESLEQ